MSLSADTHLALSRGAARRAGSVAGEYGFLLGGPIDAAMLEHACAIADQWGVQPHDVLLAKGWLSERDYYGALAHNAGLPFQPDLGIGTTAPPGGDGLKECLATGVLRDFTQHGHFTVAPAGQAPSALTSRLAALGPSRVSLTTPRAHRAAVYGHFAPSLIAGAVRTLAADHPEKSARAGLARWQRWALGVGAGALAGALLIAPDAALHVVTYSLALMFVPVIGLRVLASADMAKRSTEPDRARLDRTADASLPTYTILAALYREAHMLVPLVRALMKLDWPAAKLDIKLVLEESDTETVRAAQALKLPSNVEIVVVPDVPPRTKPKALNYALPLARGRYVVVYDAEDRPDPDQLRRAYAAFTDGPPNLAAVQARLNIYNRDASWLTRQFTLEYSALFDGLLPTLDRLRLPIPLGGTSNHFRIWALRWLLAWDPFNVTEDADLGTRLSRHGYRCATIHSTTYEEAPPRFGGWLRQRTRWLKGFMQTWAVHMRRPAALWRDLGPAGFLGFQTMIGGTLLSALVHPWFYVLAGTAWVQGNLFHLPASWLTGPVWTIAWVNLIAGYGAAMLLAARAARRRGYTDLLWQVPLMPFYWLLISAAAYRALAQLVRAPFKWEKTDHGSAAS